jgi:hypothetical protein
MIGNDTESKQAVGGKLPARCGCAFAEKNKFSSCEIVNETMHFKKDAADRKKAKKDATAKRRLDKKTAAAKIKKDATTRRKQENKAVHAQLKRI